MSWPFVIGVSRFARVETVGRNRAGRGCSRWWLGARCSRPGRYRSRFWLSAPCSRPGHYRSRFWQDPVATAPGS